MSVAEGHPVLPGAAKSWDRGFRDEQHPIDAVLPIIAAFSDWMRAAA